MRRSPLLFLVLLGLLAACSEPATPIEATIQPGDTVGIPGIRSEGIVYLKIKNASGPTYVEAQSSNPGHIQLRVSVLNRDQVSLVASADYSWFGLPTVAFASVNVEKLGISTKMAYGTRLNFDAFPNADYYLKIENFSGIDTDVTIHLAPFDLNPYGRWDRKDKLELGQSVTGAIEIVGEHDAYTIANNGYLTLQGSGAAVSFLVADIYQSEEPKAPKLATLEPDQPETGCAAVSKGQLIVVRGRGDSYAGFDEPGSMQYTLTLSNTPCP